ncbi:MAG TPA: oligoendopeptidase F [Candidatus Krumholzibacteria bacterium]|nr:oligoendopeptidase F [Candidatus Krumholzibacteria bacterium]HRX50129.1 oligoendopeptidase F [Candidatus Krumholzibacteria bacterium]
MTRTGFARRLVSAALACVVLAVGTALAYEPDPAAPRSAVPAEYTWNWSHVFPDVAAWETELAAVQELVPTLAAFEGRLGESADTLYEAVSTMEEASQRLMRLYAYTQLRLDVELSNPENQAMQGKVGFLFQQFGGTVSYMTPELLSLPEATIDAFLAQKAELKVYEYYMRDIQRMKAHTLSKAEERILSMAGQVRGASAEVSEKLRDVDLTFPDILHEDGTLRPLTLAGFGRARSSGSYAQRKLASEAFFSTFRQFENTLAATLDGVVKSHLLTKELRGYDSCLEAALKGDNIDPSVYRNLIDTINANLDRTLHKYVDLRRKVLALDGPLDFANLYNPLLDGEERAYPYEECRTILAEGLKPLGKEYVGLVKTAADPANGWIDVYPNKNKRTGAYSSGIVAWMDGGHPYVLHNYDDTLDAVFTTAHEFGHALHTYYSYKNQPFIYGDYTTFLAEVASTCNEEILLSYLLAKEKDPVQRLMLLNKRMENIRLTIFRQTLFAEFELAFHEYAEQDNALTADFLNSTYAGLIQKYYGPNFQMGENDAVEWAFIPHFNYDFYVFTYATGLTSGISLAKEIQKSGQKAADRYIDNMLKGGSSAPPLDLLRAAGVDMATPAPIVTMLDLFEDTVAEFDALWTKTFGAK